MSVNSITVEAGDLLVAVPELNDINFRRSVVLLCIHDQEGTLGLVINRPVDFDLGSVLEDVTNREHLHYGGPVRTDCLSYLHRHGDRVRKSLHVADDVYFSGAYEDVQSLIKANESSQDDLRFFAGFAGWSEGQLESEIKEGGWFVTRGNGELIFSNDPERLWGTVLRRMGGEYALLANFPEHPSVN